MINIKESIYSFRILNQIKKIIIKFKAKNKKKEKPEIIAQCKVLTLTPNDTVKCFSTTCTGLTQMDCPNAPPLALLYIGTSPSFEVKVVWQSFP